MIWDEYWTNPIKVAHRAQNADLAGEKPKLEYQDAMRKIAEQVRELCKVYRELKALRDHNHEWVVNEESGMTYCDTCNWNGDV